MALRRAILLACAAMMLAHPPCRCEAFASGRRPTAPPSSAHPSYDLISSSPRDRRHRCPPSSSTTTGGVALAAALSGRATEDRAGVDDVGDRSRPNVVRIATHEDYLEFLRQDDRVCVIKFFADWCKSCQKFGAKYRILARDLGDVVEPDGVVVRAGDVRFAEVEYTASARLCRTLKVNKLPTVHVYRAGMGKVVDMTCKPSLFHLVVDELRRVLDEEAKADANDEAAGSRRGDVATEASFHATMVAGSSLGEELVASLKRENEDEGAKKEAKWFWK